MRRIGAALGVLAFVAVNGSAMAGQATGASVLAAVQRSYDSVKDYRADMSLTIKGPKVSINDMKMTVYFKQPNKLHVDAKQGLGLVPSGSFFGNPLRDMARNAKPVYVKAEKRAGVDCHVIRLEPNGAQKGAGFMVWVDKKHSAIVAMDMPGQAGGRSTWRHEMIDGKYSTCRVR